MPGTCWKLVQPRILISCALCINVLLGVGGVHCSFSSKLHKHVRPESVWQK